MTQHQEFESKLKQQAHEQLSKVKDRETELLAQGWYYKKVDNKTLKLVPPKQK